jgi:hypothetical protein
MYDYVCLLLYNYITLPFCQQSTPDKIWDKDKSEAIDSCQKEVGYGEEEFSHEGDFGSNIFQTG